VQCACAGAGLQYRPGVPEDGRRCQQDAKLSSTLESDVLSITDKKPGNYGRSLRLNVRAEGEAPFLIESGGNCTLLRGGTRSGPLVLNTDQRVTSAFGQLIVWTTSAPGARNASVDGNALRFAESTLLDFDVRMNCTVGSGDTGECAADGDVIETVLTLSSASGGDRVSTQVTIKTTVVALVSCENTQVRITQDGYALDGDLVPAGSALHVHLAAKDADGLNVTISRAELDLQWDGMAVEFHWQRDDERGSNEYVAILPTDLHSTGGGHTLVVTLFGGWSSNVTTCVLLSRAIEVTRAANVEAIIMGAVAGALLVILGAAAIYLARKHRHRVTQLLVSFLRRETILAFKVLMELLDISGDSTRLPDFCACSHHPSGACVPCLSLVCVCSGGICELLSQRRRDGRRHIHRPVCVPPACHAGLGRVDRLKHLAPPSAGRLTANAAASTPIGEADFGPEAAVGVACWSAHAASRRRQAPGEGESQRNRAPSVLPGNAAAAAGGHPVLRDPADPDPHQPSDTGVVSFSQHTEDQRHARHKITAPEVTPWALEEAQDPPRRARRARPARSTAAIRSRC
jgi:hypothetical protein